MCSTLRPRSNSNTRRPLSVSSFAAHPPDIPEPTTIASKLVDCIALMLRHRRGNGAPMEEPSLGGPCRYNEWLFGEKAIREIQAGDQIYVDEVAFGPDDAPAVLHLGFVVRDPGHVARGAAFFRPTDRMGRRNHGHRRHRLAVLRRPHRGPCLRRTALAGCAACVR